LEPEVLEELDSALRQLVIQAFFYFTKLAEAQHVTVLLEENTLQVLGKLFYRYAKTLSTNCRLQQAHVVETNPHLGPTFD
jgi:hypothetical protein